jgi:hypothetical protein
MNSEQKVYRVPAENLGTLASKFKKLARRAKRLNLPAPTYTEQGTERVIQKDKLGNVERIILLHLITVDAGCTVVKVEGWTFIGTIQLLDEGNIVREVPGNVVPKEYRISDGYCQHCNLSRNRKDVFILKHENGEYKQIGRSCLQDYFGTSALNYAEQAQYLIDLSDIADSSEEFDGFGRGGVHYDQLEEFLAHVAEVIRQQGWMSRARAELLGGISTNQTAQWHMHRHDAPRGYSFLYDRLSENSIREASDAIEWAAELEGEELNNYLHNLRVIARRMVVSGREYGLAASMIAAFQRHLGYLRRQELLSRQKETSTYQGELGKKLRIKVAVDRVISCQGGYGSQMHVMSDVNGNAYVWYASNETLEVNSEVWIEGTVKKHNDYHGLKQTILNRCSVLQFRTYTCTISEKVYSFEACEEKEAKAMLREKLGVRKLPNGIRFIIEEKVSE